MSLKSGDRIGPYDVTAQIGAGGMGEVYRATDTNLKRSVAIKVLPGSVAADADRLVRFQREAINTELDVADAPITLLMNWNPDAKNR
jgi:eukaryotic-like serine/threonine-protein kinase